MYYRADGGLAQLGEIVQYLVDKVEVLEDQISANGHISNFQSMYMNQMSALQDENNELKERLNKLEFLMGDN